MTNPPLTPVNPEDFSFESVYGALRAQARQYLRRERSAQSISPTVLVHEAWMSLARSRTLSVNDRSHYFRLVSRVMKNLLVDHARNKRAIYRGGAMLRADLAEASALPCRDTEQVLAVAASMERLAAHSASLAFLVELRFFSGFSEREVAQILGVSVRTVRRQWTLARLRLMESLRSEPGAGADA